MSMPAHERILRSRYTQIGLRLVWVLLMVLHAVHTQTKLHTIDRTNYELTLLRESVFATNAIVAFPVSFGAYFLLSVLDVDFKLSLEQQLIVEQAAIAIVGYWQWFVVIPFTFRPMSPRRAESE
jgi:hypothetical protein